MKYKLAGRVVQIDALYVDTQDALNLYRYEGDKEAEYSFSIPAEEVQRCKGFFTGLSGSDIESKLLALQFYKWILFHNATYIHSCALELDGLAYVFTADSGTGKSTHASLWVRRYGDDVHVINDDKSFIRVTDDGRALVCGSPWHGKIRTDMNVEVPIAGICVLEQDESNSIERIPVDEAAFALITQIFYSNTESTIDSAISLLDRIVKAVPVYRLKCNISQDAAVLAYNTMCPEVKRK